MTPAPAPQSPLTLADAHAWIAEALPTFEGWCSVEKGDRLLDLVVTRDVGVSVDLGVFGGKSMLALALGHVVLQHGYVVGVDAWATDATLDGVNDPANDEWWKTINLPKLQAQVFHYFETRVPKPTWQFLTMRTLAAADYFDVGEVQLLHQDSNHSEEVSCAELSTWHEKMAPGSLWVMDDAEWPTLQEVQRRMTSPRGRYRFTLLEDYKQWRVYEVPR